MATLNISDDLNVILENSASRSGLSKDAYLEELILTNREDESLPLSAFTEGQLAHFKEAIEQVKTGVGLIPSEEIDSRFERFYEETRAR